MVSTQLPPLPTRSTITATTSNGVHELTMEGYSVTKLLVPGEHIDTHKFTAAGHDWRICYYLNGGKETDRSMSFFLKMEDVWMPADMNIRVKFGFSLVPGQGTEPVPGELATIRFAGKPRVVDFPHKKNKDVEHWGLTISKRELEKSLEYLCDDSFVLRCEIAVMDKLVVKNHGGLPAVCPCKDELCKLHHLKGGSWLKGAVAKYFLDCLST